MHLRPGRPEDIRALAELSALAFPDRRTVGERARSLEEGRPYGGIETVWLLEERGRIVGSFKALRMTQHLSGVALPMLGLASVAVSPDARRRGVGARLVQEVIRIGRERGDVVSALYPFRPEFYRRFGWGLAGELRSHVFRPEWLPPHPHEAVRVAWPEDGAAIETCYARVAAASNGLLARTAGIWSQYTGAALRTFVHDEGGVRGYVRVKFGRARSPELRRLEVLELIAEDDAVYRALLGWIAAQADQWRLVRYDAGVDERFELRLREPRPPEHRPARWLWYPTARVIRGPMLRVVDVAALLARRRWPAGLPACAIEVAVEDGEAPWNRGPHRIAIEGGTAAATEAAPAARLATGADVFAQIIAGELPPSAAVRLGVARIEGDARLLDDAFRPSEPFRLLDEF